MTQIYAGIAFIVVFLGLWVYNKILRLKNSSLKSELGQSNSVLNQKNKMELDIINALNERSELHKKEDLSKRNHFENDPL